ncbi:MAG: copper resistance protein NlpE N-terminal domain-containing protein, partial [Flavobacteriales bacterium]|nr:copper resistance protein NlpE N-terminal domain-containing protein [Flavobacteriales bacterium]
MRKLLLSIPVLAFCSCATPAPEAEAVDASSEATPSKPVIDADPVGLYHDTMPCADCPGILTDLWVRADGSYLFQETYLDRDPMPFGTMGSWEMRAGQLVLMEDRSPLMFYAFTMEGLQQVDANGKAHSASMPLVLRRTRGTLLDRPMRISGIYSYADESHTMRPCGMTAELPLGMQQAGLEMAMWSSERDDSNRKPLVVEIQAHLGMGPAMEGNEEEEYLFVDKVLRQVGSGVCPSRAT